MASQWNPPAAGADIFKIHLKSRLVVRLTNQQFTPNLGAGDWASDFRNASRKEESQTSFRIRRLQYGAMPVTERPSSFH